MDNSKLLSDPRLKKLTRTFHRGDNLFVKDDMGNTVFLVLSGKVQLVVPHEGRDCVIGYIEAGEFMGEKAIAQNKPFPRFCSAVAITDVVALELGLTELSKMEQDSLELYHRLTKIAFRVASLRLERMAELIPVLKEIEPKKRFLQFLKLQCKHHSTKSPKGLSFEINPTTVFYYLGIPEGQISTWMKDLLDQKALQNNGLNQYLVQDENVFETIPMEHLKAA